VKPSLQAVRNGNRHGSGPVPQPHTLQSRSDRHVGLQALPLHQFEYLVSCMRRASMTSAMHDLEESSLARLASPDVLTPAQYYGRIRSQHPEAHAMKRLMLAVLEDALRCLQIYAEGCNPAHRQACGEAETWILDRRAQGPFAFDTICEALGIQADYLRDGIRRWRVQLSNGLDSRRLHRRSVRGSVPTSSLVRRRSNRSEPPFAESASH
jgi:hypothetical protein